MSSSVDIQQEEEKRKKLRIDAEKGEWSKVIQAYKQESALRSVEITETGDTVLHMAVSNGQDKTVEEMVNIIVNTVDEESWNVNATPILGAKNKKGNTPLHLAASKGSFEKCEKIGGADASLITICNRADLAVDIVLLYEDNDLRKMTLMRNKNGLSPLHLLATTPSAFQSTDLSGRSFLVQLLYHWVFKVNNKQQATKPEELNERETLIEALMDAFLFKWGDTLSDERCLSCIWIVTVSLLGTFILLFLLVPLLLLEKLILSAGNWFRGIRKMKEKHAWSVQIMEKLFKHVSEEYIAQSYEVDREEGTIIVDTPLMIAAQNGVIEMVVKILQLFPSTIEVVNEEGKNIVLLAVEKRQTNLYQFLCGYLDINAFRKVDNDGNTALHSAAMLGLNLNMQTTTMIEELKWFDLVKSSVPCEFREKHNHDGKTAEDIFRESYKELNTSDRQWLDQFSQTCPVASTVVASMAFSNFAGENIDKKNYSSLVALSLSLTSTISFLAMLSFRSHSRNFWTYVPFMLNLAILTMIGSIVALWISLMVHGKSFTSYAIIGSPIAILTIVSLPIFIGHTLMSAFAKVPPPNRSTTSAIRYQRPQKKEDGKDFYRNKQSTPNYTSRENDSLQDIGSSRGRARIKRRHTL